MSKKYQNLEQLQKDRERILEEMQGVRDRFVETFVEDLPRRWEKRIRAWVEANPERAKALGQDGLSDLKKALAHLSGRAVDVANEHLSGSSVWTHEAPDDGKVRTYYADPNTPDGWVPVSSPMKKAEQEVNDLIREAVSEQLIGNYRTGEEGSLTPELVEIIQEYSKLDNRLAELTSDIRNLKGEIEKDEATKMWDGA